MTPEQQRALALARARRRREEAQSTAQTQLSQPDNGGGFLGFLNQGIASSLGAPVDLVNAGLGAIGLPVSEEPFLGSRSIGRGMGSIGARVAEPGAQPENLMDYVGRGMGGAAGALPLGAGLVGLASNSASPVAQGVSQSLSQPFVNTPARALIAESLAGAGAGTGEAIANQIAPGSAGAQLTGALAGGVIGGMGPMLASRGVQSTPVLGTALRMGAAEIAPFTEAGAMQRARGRMSGLVEDRDAALRNLDQESIGGLSPAARTGDRRLMGLEQTIRRDYPEIDLSMRQAETESAARLRDEFSAPARGQTPEAARSYATERLGRIVGQMDERIAQAEQNAQRRIAALEPSRQQADASLVVREELESALASARKQENELWSAVPRDAMVPTVSAKQRYRAIVEDMPSAQRDDLPSKARDFLEEGGNQTFGSQESVREMHGLYSALRQEARNARAGDTPSRNKARIADDLADALLDDMNTVSGASVPLREALDFSRQVNERFRQGSVGRALGNERTGGDRVSDIQTLDRTIGRGGRAGAVGYDEVARALQGNGSQSSQAMDDYVRGRFADAAIRDGSLRTGPAQSFQNSNADLLSRMPDTQQRIADALLADSTSRRVGATMRGRQSAVERRSAASTLIGARPGEEMQTILRSANPQETARQLMRQARNDPSGAAQAGLKDVVLGDLIIGGRTGNFDEAGQALVSGRNIQSRLDDPRYNAVATEILTPQEIERTNRIAQEFSNMEMMARRGAEAGPIMGDQPNSIISYLARSLAARQGAQMGRGGASLQTAQMASKRMQRILEGLTNNRAEELLVRSAQDEDLYRLLLSEGTTMTRQQENRLIETMSGIFGAEIASDPVAEALSR